ncbi:MAG: rhodanese-like domain-containing protein, partial [Verrucomicrobiota bacterium]
MKALRALAVLFASVAAAFAADPAPKISAAEAAKLVESGKAVLVDCREPAEWKDGDVAKPAVLLPKSDFDGDQKQWKEFLAKNKGKQVIVYCRSGGRAGAVAGALNQQGVSAASVGGLKDWTAAGLPTRKAEPAKTEPK